MTKYTIYGWQLLNWVWNYYADLQCGILELIHNNDYDPTSFKDMLEVY